MRAFQLKRATAIGVMWLVATMSGCFEEEEGGSPTPASSTASTTSSVVSDGTKPVWEVTEPAAHLTELDALLDFINEVRESLAVEPVVFNEELQAAAQAHAEFIATHRAVYEAEGHSYDDQGVVSYEGVSYHDQIEGLAGFTGLTADDRAKTAGYEGACFNEIIAFKPTSVGAMQASLETLYHRFAITDPRVTEIGYAEAGEGVRIINVLKVGTRDEQVEVEPFAAITGEVTSE